MEETNSIQNKWADPKIILTALAIIIFGTIVIVSIVREKIVNESVNEVSVTGQGKVSYQPDTAKITLGVQIDRRPTSEQAINELNETVAKIIPALEQVGITKEDIETQNYSLTTQYDYSDGKQNVAGYDANQRLIVTVKEIQNDKEKIGRIISAASQAGSNQMLGVNFETKSINDLKQEARILAINDAKAKSKALADAAGIKLGKVTGWYENSVSSPENPVPYGMGGAMDKAVSAVPQAQVPSGTEEIVIEVNLNYEVK